MWKRLKKYAKKLAAFLRDKVKVTIDDDLFNSNDLPR